MLDAVDPQLDDTAAPDPAHTKTLAASSRSAPGNELPAGLRLGHFRIDKQLGAGGMGEVYLATDLALDRPVAIKVLPEAQTSGAARERLIREARAQARIQHPNVAHIYFIGEDDGRLYFAMEYVTGQTVADRLATGPFPVEDALDVIRGAVLGLREAQRSGFTHRDVKPSNLMIDAHGIVKVLDFGLVAGAPGEVGDKPVEQTSLAGTPLYMAPEQARGEAVDLRADIYALGATLFHLVSGKPPFQAETIAELASMHATSARPALPRGGNPRTAIAAIDSLIAKMMAPRIEDRFATYDELLRALELVSSQHTRPAGFWVRMIATGIDMMIVGLFLALVAMPFGGGTFGMGVVGPIALVYAGLAIARWGTTGGKAVFELEVVAIATGKRPSWQRALQREAILVAAPAVWSIAEHLQKAFAPHVLPTDLFSILGVTSMVVLIVHLMYSAVRTPGKRTYWDRASGTQVRYRATRRDTGALLP